MLLTEMNNSGASTLHVVDPQNGKATELRTHGSSYDPAFSPNGKSIAYVSNPGDQLWTQRLSGKGPARQITFDNGSCCYIGSPVFGPTGDSLFYGSSDGFSGSFLNEVSIDGSATTEIGSWINYSLETAISPNGKRIALVSRTFKDCGKYCLDYGDAQIHILDRDGTGQRILETGLSADSPSFSPDGTRIAFVGSAKGVDDVSQIYSISTDGSELKKLTDGPLTHAAPFFHRMVQRSLIRRTT